MRYLGKQPRVSGDRIDGGEITNFKSTGIDDNATETKVTVTDATTSISNDVSVTGDLSATDITAGNLTTTATTGTGGFGTELVVDYDNDRVGINTTPQFPLDVAGDFFHLVDDDSSPSEGPTVLLDRDSATPADDDQLAKICIRGKNDADEYVAYSEMRTYARDVTDGSEDGEIEFAIAQNGSLVSTATFSPTEIILNNDQVDMDIRIESQSQDDLLFINTGLSRVGVGTTTPEQKLHVVGDVKIDGTITFSDTAAGSGAPTFTIQDENNTGADANSRLRFSDAPDQTLGEVRLKDGDLHIYSDDQFIIGVDSLNSYGEDKANILYAHKRLAETPLVVDSANLTITPQPNPEYFSEQTQCTISTSNTGDFSGFSVGDVCKIQGCSNEANNQLTRIMAIDGDTMTLNGFRVQFISETGGTITLSKGGGPCMHVPPYVNFTYTTYPQTEDTSRVATMAYVRDAISDLVDSSPLALDTLNELAAAINDDANFATTVTNSLAEKVNLAGGTMTGFLTLHANPTASGHASTKSYVDTSITNIAANRDLDNLNTAGVEYIEDSAAGIITGATHSGLSVNYDSGSNLLAFNVNDPLLTVNANSGDVRGSGSATMTDLSSTTITMGLTLQEDVIEARHLDTEDGVNNIINGLPELASEESFQNDDYLIFADDSAGGALRKVRKGKAIPPAFTEDLGYFAIAMS